jgi:glycosyltransferase involved in cell wall biosynthesis
MNSESKTVTNVVLNNFKNDSRVLKISRTLAKNGFLVRVVALHEEPLLENEKMEGFDVHRVKLFTRSWSRKRIIQLFKYLEFTLRVLIKFNDHDIYHCNDLQTLPVGILLKIFSFRKVKIVYDAHEYETEVNGLGRLEQVLRRWLERALIRFVDKTITVSDSIAEEYVRLYGIEKPEIILNIPSLSSEIKHDLFRQNLGISANTEIYLYQGNLSPGRGIRVLLDVFDKIMGAGRAIVFMGYGDLEKEIQARAKNSGSIYYHDAVSADQIPQFTSSADIGISTIENTCLSYYYCLPNKLFEYLMAEIPVIVSNLPEMGKLVREYGLGVVANENSVAGINQALDDMDRFDRAAFFKAIGPFKSRYNWEAQEETLVSVYANI